MTLIRVAEADLALRKWGVYHYLKMGARKIIFPAVGKFGSLWMEVPQRGPGGGGLGSGGSPVEVLGPSCSCFENDA